MKKILPLAILYFVILWATESTVGFTRDEGYYFKAAEEYSGWFGVLFSSRFGDAFTDAEIMRHFSYNTEHPAGVKLTQGITFHVFSEWLGVASASTGFRIAGFFFAALSMIATFLLGRALFSEKVGLLAAVFLATLPRYFFDAHLACFDVAITAMWTLSLWAFHRALYGPEEVATRRALVAAVVFGLALATKLNALFLPFVFVLVWVAQPPDRGGAAFTRSASGGLDIRLPPVPIVLFYCALIGPLVFIACWPYLWHDTFNRIGTYIGFHLHHEHYPISFFGDLLVKPPFPWTFPIWMTVYTVPLPFLVLGTIGFAVASRHPRKNALLLLAVALPIFLIAMPSSPIFGGVKHWYNAMPALAILAAHTALDGLEIFRRKAVRGSLVGLALLPGVLGIVRSHPNGIGFYNELAGGFRGGAELGMQRGFWGGLAYPLYGELPKGRVFFNRTNYDSYRMYRQEGKIPKSVTYANDAKHATIGVHFEQPEHGEAEGEIWSVLGTRPSAGVYHHNVTLIQLYRSHR